MNKIRTLERKQKRLESIFKIFNHTDAYYSQEVTRSNFKDLLEIFQESPILRDRVIHEINNHLEREKEKLELKLHRYL